MWSENATASNLPCASYLGREDEVVLERCYSRLKLVTSQELSSCLELLVAGVDGDVAIIASGADQRLIDD